MPTLHLAEPFFALGDHIAIDLPGARALFTTRRGGASEPPYDELNLGVLTAADPAVARNLGLLEHELGVSLAFGRQVHGTAVRVAATSAAVDGELQIADAIATTEPGIAPMVLAADCLPIALAGAGVVAIVHAGWQGLAAGVLNAAARTVRALARDGRGAAAAAIGPGAGVCCYEVGDELHMRFAARGEDFREGRHLDLKAIARAQLEAEGIGEIHDVALCTICSDPGAFFSHRRERGVTGRQAGIVWLN